jgi:hypothetical protein
MTKGQTSRIAVLFTTLALSACGSQGAQPEQISEGGDPQTPATPPVVETPRQSTNSEGGNTPTAGTEPVVEVPRTNSEDGERSPARSPPVVEETRQSTASGKVSTSLRLTLTYSEKILVPKGSELKINVQDSTGQTIFSNKIKTDHDAPPYRVEVPLRKDISYPLIVDAELLSKIGHRFSEHVNIVRSGLQGANTVTIRLQKQ